MFYLEWFLFLFFLVFYDFYFFDYYLKFEVLRNVLLFGNLILRMVWLFEFNRSVFFYVFLMILELLRIFKKYISVELVLMV